MSPYITEVSDNPHDMSDNSLSDAFPHLYDDPTTLSPSYDPFTITTSTGFMPLRPPQLQLPSAFAALQKLADDLPVVKLDGSPGLLANYELGPAIDKQRALPDLNDEIDQLIAPDGRPDLAAVTAAFRDYAFIASSYLLEPCWERYSKGLEGYGLGRQKLPKCIAGPLVKTANMLNIHPFMSYAAAYSLYNYRFADPAVGLKEYDNLRLIRAFEKGLDPKSSEAGFILVHPFLCDDRATEIPLTSSQVHVDIVKHTAGLIKGTADVLGAIESRSSRADVVDGMETMLHTMRHIEASMETMWGHSKPQDYNTYRTFIFGITNQSMFPNGVVYEGENDNEPLYFRGESGANDSIIPLLDSLLEIPMPQNPLTEILKDFRSYRPKPHREFLAYVRSRAEELGVREYCCNDVETTVLYLRLLDHVRSFRWRHWLFAREYIIKRSSHPTATGGSPIVTWLPNQLFAVLELMTSVWDDVASSDKAALPRFISDMMDNVAEQQDKLQREVDRWCSERGVPVQK